MDGQNFVARYEEEKKGFLILNRRAEFDDTLGEQMIVRCPYKKEHGFDYEVEKWHLALKSTFKIFAMSGNCIEVTLQKLQYNDDVALIFNNECGIEIKIFAKIEKEYELFSIPEDRKCFPWNCDGHNH